MLFIESIKRPKLGDYDDWSVVAADPSQPECLFCWKLDAHGKPQPACLYQAHGGIWTVSRGFPTSSLVLVDTVFNRSSDTALAQEICIAEFRNRENERALEVHELERAGILHDVIYSLAVHVHTILENERQRPAEAKTRA